MFRTSILYQGFWYCFDKLLVINNNIIYWRCRVNTCKAFIKTKDDILAQDCNLVHNHDKKPGSHITRRVVSNMVTKNAKNNPYEKPSNAIRVSVQNYTKRIKCST